MCGERRTADVRHAAAPPLLRRPAAAVAALALVAVAVAARAHRRRNHPRRLRACHRPGRPAGPQRTDLRRGVGKASSVVAKVLVGLRKKKAGGSRVSRSKWGLVVDLGEIRVAQEERKQGGAG